MDGVTAQQLETCDRFGVTPVPAPSDEKVGIALNVRDGARPVKAVRHLPVGDTTGWYIWAGDTVDPALTEGDDFFVPLHVSHVAEWSPEIVPYLALPPGHGVIVERGYEDVWFDASLLVE
jgi:hypothetical protein